MFSFFSRKLTKDKFAEMVQAALRESGATAPFEYRKEDFSLRCEKQIFYMGNTFDMYCAAKEPQRSVIVDNIVSIFVRKDAQISREEALSTVVAVIRERALFYFASLLWQMEEMGDGKQKMLHEPISDWYSRSLVLDAPGHMRFVGEEQLEEWGMTFDELFAVGLERLMESTPIQFQEEGGYFVGLWKDDYDSSRVLLPDLFTGLGLNGDPVFVLPNRLTLMVAGARDEQAIAAMLEQAEAIVQNEPRSQNPGPLTYRNGELQDFRVPAGSKLYHPVQRAQKLAALQYYAEQAQRLTELYEKNGRDYFVASCKVQQHNETGAYTSLAVWSKGIPSLLPKTDQICFYDPETKLMVWAPFAHVLQVLGDLMLDTQMFPVRYYVSQFPSEEQLRAMEAEAR